MVGPFTEQLRYVCLYLFDPSKLAGTQTYVFNGPKNHSLPRLVSSSWLQHTVKDIKNNLFYAEM